MSDIYDLAILGGGPAGITAAIYASRARLNTIWIDKNFAPGGQVTATYAVDNYPTLLLLASTTLPLLSVSFRTRVYR